MLRILETVNKLIGSESTASFEIEIKSKKLTITNLPLNRSSFKVEWLFYIG